MMGGGELVHMSCLGFSIIIIAIELYVMYIMLASYI